MSLPLTKLENIALIIITIPLTLSPACLLLLVRLGDYRVNLCAFYFYKIIGKLTAFFTVSGVQLVQHHRGQFHYHRVAFSSKLKSSVCVLLPLENLLWVKLRDYTISRVNNF